MEFKTTNETINKFLSVKNPKWYQKFWFAAYLMYLHYIKREEIFVVYKSEEEKDSEMYFAPYYPKTCEELEEQCRKDGVALTKDFFQDTKREG